MCYNIKKDERDNRLKTLIINGSPRKNGDTAALINTFRENLNSQYKIINSYYCNISPCVDCRFCRINKGCAIDDEMTELYRYIEECDNVLIASPIYFSELTGRVLDIGSRLQTYFSMSRFRKEQPPIKPKKGAVILAGGGSGNPLTAYETAKRLLGMMNACDVFPLVCSFNTDNTPSSQDKKTLEKVKKAADFFNRTE